jgi:aminopeptidase
VSLVDVRSPINQSGILFYDTLFDENAVCHIAFGKAYLEAMDGADQMTEEHQREAGLNDSDAHEDFMIGTSTMHVYGICVDGSEITIMQNGQFVELS